MKFQFQKKNALLKKNEKDEIELLKIQVFEYDWSKFDRFEDIPISQPTKRGLAKNNYFIPTDIQKQSIGYALSGNDVLGAAKTGSGKTLAFLIPMIECLYKNRWTSLDGVGALIISPTRELSYQTFEVLKKIGSEHDFSAGLIIGGKDLKFESKRMDRCNIIVCTPGRLLQHMDENPRFNCENLKILILDEADRILDLGFAKTMNAIIGNLPKHRQTLLFSATQTKSIKDLAKLSLKHPIYISSHEHEKHVTPNSLTQSYIVCELEEKINLLWSFIKQHIKQKIIVFMSTCKQVKFIYELFCQLRPGIPLLALYGNLHQLKRMIIYDKFCESSRIVLFATDIAARGLDFPSINWVVQLDCPEDTNTYIHRVGRTARFEKNGESLLILTPSEENSMITQLKDEKVPIEKIFVNPKKCFTIHRKAEALLAKHLSLKESAQRAFKSYLKSVFLMSDKSIFKYECLNVDSFAKSLGLLNAPRIRFIERKIGIDHKETIKNKTVPEDNQVSLKNDKINANFDENSDNDFDDLFKVKQYKFDDSTTNVNDNHQNISDISKRKKSLTKVAISKRLLKKNIKLNTKIVFDENCNAIQEKTTKQTSEFIKQLEKVESGIDIELAKKIMKDEDVVDKKLYRNIVKEKYLNKKLKMKELRSNKKYNRNSPESSEFDVRNDDNNYEEFDENLTQCYIDALPDPEKVFNNNENSNQNDSNDYLINDDEFLTKTKRKLSNQQDSSKKIKNLEYYEKMAQELLDI